MNEEEMKELQEQNATMQATIEALQKDKEEAEIREAAQKELLEKISAEHTRLKEEISSVKKTNFILSQQGNAQPTMTAEEAIAGMFGLKKEG